MFNTKKMARIIIALLVLLPVAGMSQNYLTKTKTQVKKQLAKYVSNNKGMQTSVTETDTTITLSIKDKQVQPAEFIYSFNRAGKCTMEKTVAYCDSCLTKFLTALLNRKEYEWRKINENQYISKFSAAMMIELPVESTDHYFILLQMGWTKKQYDMMSGN